jgi:hypothetical protein
MFQHQGAFQAVHDKGLSPSPLQVPVAVAFSIKIKKSYNIKIPDYTM